MTFLDVLFGCSHKNLSFPITVRGARRRPQAAAVSRTYVVCLDCGHEFPYDWEEMRVVREDTSRPIPAVAAAPRRVA